MSKKEETRLNKTIVRRNITIRNLNKNICELRDDLHKAKEETAAVKRVIIAEKQKPLGKAITGSPEFEDAVQDMISKALQEHWSACHTDNDDYY